MGSIEATDALYNDQVLGTRRRLRLICIGAGFSGLTLAHKVKHEGASDFIDLTIFEKNSGVGGTWHENHYPGAACDVPAHIYAFHFAPNPNWSAFYAPAPEIREYIEDVATKWGLYDYVQLNSKVIACTWSDEKGTWSVTVEKEGVQTTHDAEILVNSGGVLNIPRMPDIPGLESFKGPVLHSARWDHTVDFNDKRVGIIGNGSSAIQIIPQIQKQVKSLISYIRNPTWIATPFLSDMIPNGEDLRYTDEQRETFRNDPAELYKLRLDMEHNINIIFKAMIKGSPEQVGFREYVTMLMKQRLASRPDLIERLVPDFELGCRRLTPGPGYLEALQQENVRVSFDKIKRIDATGMVCERENADGTTTEVQDEFDILVCTTGFDVSFVPPYPITGRNGVSLNKLWATDPQAYMSISAPDMPNYFMYLGPNCPLSHGSLFGGLIGLTDYVVSFCEKVSTQNIKSFTISPAALTEFNEYTQAFLQQTVWSGGCRSWYQNQHDRSKVSAMYAGSIPHYMEMLSLKRWEDYEWVYYEKNRFRFMGNGFTKMEQEGKRLGEYLPC